MERVGLLGDTKHPISRVDRVRIALLKTKEAAAPIFGLPFAAFGCSPKAADAYKWLVDRVCHRQIPKLSDQALVETAKTIDLTPYLVNDPTRQLAARAIHALSQLQNPFEMFEVDDAAWKPILNQRLGKGNAAFGLAAPHLPPEQKEVLRQLLAAKFEEVFGKFGYMTQGRLVSPQLFDLEEVEHLLSPADWQRYARSEQNMMMQGRRRDALPVIPQRHRPYWQERAHKILEEKSLKVALGDPETHGIVKDYPKAVEIYEQAFARAPDPALKLQLFRLRALAFGIDLPKSNGETVTVVVTGNNKTIELQVDRAALDASCHLLAQLDEVEGKKVDRLEITGVTDVHEYAELIRAVTSFQRAPSREWLDKHRSALNYLQAEHLLRADA